VRAAGVTAGFVAAGAVAGSTAAVLSLIPLWLGLTPLPRNFIQGWSLVVIAGVGAVCGAVVTPILGWLVIERTGFWRSVLALLSGAVLGENIAALLLWSLQTDVLILGALLGALATTLIIRLRQRADNNS
jgi:hypothetical protein